MRIADDTAPATYLTQIGLLFKRIGLVYLLYTASRLLFYFVNRPFFENTETRLIRDLVNGLRFDSFSIVLSNTIFIVLSILPLARLHTRAYQKTLKAVFVVSNLFFLAFNYIDSGYFQYIRKRSTADLLEQFGGQSDLAALSPAIAADYWWLVTLYIFNAFILIRIYPAGKRRSDFAPVPVLQKFLIPAAILSLAVLAIRGGTQPSPIDIVDAGASTSAGRESIVLNSPFTIIKSLDKKAITAYAFFPETEADLLFPTDHRYPEKNFSKKNVVVIVLESFSKDYTALGNRKSYTPFLDSLMEHSTVFTNAYSNSAKSIEGLPAILSSLPSFMDNPFINSRYANNRQTSFATLLGDEGYTTAFFHGGKNGTMNFTEWAKLAGYQEYHGMNEYPGDDDYDGFWGIYDEPFLQYCAGRLNRMPTPFHAALFTLSSHHPYPVPKNFSRNPGENDVATAIRYADHSLRKFFGSAARMSWFDSTLFVLVADHATISKDLFIPDPLGNLRIPILIFEPARGIAEIRDGVFGQTDILPEVMHRLGYNKPFFSFGKQVGNEAPHFVCYYGDGRHQLITDSLFFLFSGPDLHAVHNYRRDSSLSNKNLSGTFHHIENAITRKFHAMLQTYSDVMINDKGYYRSPGSE